MRRSKRRCWHHSFTVMHHYQELVQRLATDGSVIESKVTPKIMVLCRYCGRTKRETKGRRP